MAVRKLKPIEERDPYAALVLGSFDALSFAEVVEREKIGVYPVAHNKWAAFKFQGAGQLAEIAGRALPTYKAYGKTATEAVSRCYELSQQDK